MPAIYDYLEEKHGTLPGSERSLRNFIYFLITTETLKLNEKARIYKSVPELPLGKQMQLDFGQYVCPGGLKLYILATLLLSSRYKYAVFQDTPFKTGSEGRSYEVTRSKKKSKKKDGIEQLDCVLHNPTAFFLIDLFLGGNHFEELLQIKGGIKLIKRNLTNFI